MPVLWHQSLLTFVQRYKNDISTEQREALIALLRYVYRLFKIDFNLSN